MKTFESQVRVRYQETDNMGVVYYANYLVWLEIARTEHLRSLGISYRELEEKGMYLMVTESHCQYKSPARYDDMVKIQCLISEVRSSSLKYEYKLFVGDTLAAVAETVHVFTNKFRKPIRIPEEIKKVISG